MKKICILIFFLFLSCNKKKESIPEIKTNKDVSFYLKKIANNKTPDKEILNLNDKAFKINKLEKNDIKRKENLEQIINNYFNLNEWNKYKSASINLLNLSKSSGDSIFYAKSLRYLGNYYFNNKTLDSSFYYYLKSEKIYLNLKDNYNYSIILLKKGIVQLNINDFLGADISLRKSYNILKDSDDFQRKFSVLNSLGNVASELKESNRAISYYKKALEILKKDGTQNAEHQEANCLNNIGLLYSDLKNYEKAIFYYEKALSNKYLKTDNPDLYSIIIDNLAYSKLKSNKLNGLPNLFFDSLKSKDSLANFDSKSVVYIHLSEYFSIVKDTFRSIDYSLKAIENSKKSNIPIFKIAAYKQASLVDKKRSTFYSDKYIKLIDSIQFVERNSKDRFARIELDTEEIIQKNGVLETRNRNLLLVFIITVIILGLLFVVRAQRAKTRELLYKQAQQKANEEIYNLMISQQAVIDENRTLEKKRLAQDLHDGVLGRMFGLRLNLDSLNHSTDENAPQKRNELLNELKTIEQDIREISHDLSREKQELVNNFVSIVHNLIEEQQVNHGSEVELFVDKTIPWDKLANNAKINLYRMLQEGLQNINKYAQAKNIIVEIKKIEESVSLMIKDDGVGFDVSKKAKGIGMQNMLSRTKECGGIITVESKKGAGTKIEITIPIEIKHKEPKTEKTINIETINT